jgi:hypothetical protein
MRGIVLEKELIVKPMIFIQSDIKVLHGGV